MPCRQRKIAIMGYRSVGKSSITIQFVDNQFVDAYDPTIGNTFSTKTKVRGQEYELELIDTAGQDEYSLLSTQDSLSTHGYVLVYSINSRKSFDVIQVIREKILDAIGSSEVPLVLVGNKTDLRNDRVISVQEGQSLASGWNAAFIESSAKDYQKVKEIFETMVLNIEKADKGPEEKSGCVLC